MTDAAWDETQDQLGEGEMYEQRWLNEEEVKFGLEDDRKEFHEYRKPDNFSFCLH
jgi:hypothetical protein